MNYKKDLFFVIGLSFSVNVFTTCIADTPQHDMVQCNYTAFKVILSCKNKLAVMSWASFQKDIGSENTKNWNKLTSSLGTVLTSVKEINSINKTS